MKFQNTIPDRKFKFSLTNSNSMPVILKKNTLMDPKSLLGKTSCKDFFYEPSADQDYNFISDKTTGLGFYPSKMKSKKTSKSLLKAHRKASTSRNFRISTHQKKAASKGRKATNLESDLEKFFARTEHDNKDDGDLIKTKVITPRQREMYKTVGFNFWMSKASKDVDKRIIEKQKIQKALVNDMYDYGWDKDRMETDIKASNCLMNMKAGESSNEGENPYLLDTKISKGDAKIIDNLLRKKELEERMKRKNKVRKRSNLVFNKEKADRDNGDFEFEDKSQKIQIPEGIILQHSHMNEFYLLEDFERRLPDFYYKDYSKFIHGSGQDSRDIHGIIKSRKLYLLEAERQRKIEFLEKKSKSAKEALMYVKKSARPRLRHKRRRNWRKTKKYIEKGKVNTDLMVKDRKRVPSTQVDLFSPKRVQMVEPYKSYWMGCIDKLLKSDNCLKVSKVGYYSITLKRIIYKEYSDDGYELLSDKERDVVKSFYWGVQKVEYDLETERIHSACKKSQLRRSFVVPDIEFIGKNIVDNF